MTTVTPNATPPAMRNCGEASRAKTAGEEDLSAVIIPGDILLRRLDNSASVSATAAIASGFACKFEMIVVAEWCKHCASRSKVSNFDIVAASSASRSLSVAAGERASSGGGVPYARFMSMLSCLISGFEALRVSCEEYGGGKSECAISCGESVCLRTICGFDGPASSR